MNSSEKTRFEALTGLRWFAALAVIFRHNRPPGDSMFSTFFENGYSGVTVFFVLSGFVLTVRYFNEFQHPTRDLIRGYFFARLARIYPSYLLVILIVGLIDGFPRASTFVQHLLMVQTWSSDSDVAYALNGPGWSIGVEAFLYLVFPVIAVLLGRSRNMRTTAGISAVVVFMLMAAITIYFSISSNAHLAETDKNSAWRWIYRNPAFRLGDFVLGMSLGVFVLRREVKAATNWIPATIATLSFLSIVIAMANRPTLNSALSMDLLYSIPTIGLIYGLACPGKHLIKRFLEKPLIQWLGEISFAAYLVHVPIGQKLRQFLGSRFEIGHWSVTFILVLISTVVAASALHYIFERPLRSIIRRLA